MGIIRKCITKVDLRNTILINVMLYLNLMSKIIFNHPIN